MPRLDDIAADLLVEASCITRSENNILYQFSVSAAGRLLLDGRAAVVLDAGALTPDSGRNAMKNALVTGGSGGIGAAICRRLAADGCHVYVHAHRGLQAAQTLADAICAGGGSAQALAFDVTDSAATAAALSPARRTPADPDFGQQCRHP